MERATPYRTSFMPDEIEDLSDETAFDTLSQLAARAAAASAEALWLDKPAPRYTSYPSATAFSEQIGAPAYMQSLAALPATEPVSVYLHIPFCRSLCLYCGCNTCVTHGNERIDSYVGTLCHEIESLAVQDGIPHRISRLHFGGGSPNILTPAALGTIFATLHRTFSFSFADEVAMELDPRLISRDFVRALVTCGVTRVSLGIQDFNPDVQRVIRREQSFDLIARVCDQLRDAGIGAINFDLIYGLPLQTPESLARTAAQAATLAPSRIALYSYAHVPQIKKHQKVLEASGLPGKYALLALESAARATLIAAGYRPVGMDHFAQENDALAVADRADALHRNFQGYTDDTARTLLAFGASSIARTPDGYFQNERDPKFYDRMVWDRAAPPIVRGYLLSGEDRVRAAVIEKLMCHLSCDIQAVCRAHHYALANFAAAFDRLEPFVKAGIVARDGYVIKLNTAHRMAIRVVAQIFDNTAPPNVVASRTS